MNDPEALSQNNNNESEILIPVQVVYDQEEEFPDQDGALRTFSKNKNKKNKYSDKYNKYDDDTRGDYHEDRDKVVIQVRPTEPIRYPKCRHPNEEWSNSYGCDEHCINDGTTYSDRYDDEYDHDYYRSARYKKRCRRMVSDTNRTKKNFEHLQHHSSPEYVIVEKERPQYHPPAGECICSNGYSRFHGRCIPNSDCPSKFLMIFDCFISKIFHFLSSKTELYCPRNRVYSDCASCQKTCGNYKDYDYRENPCVCYPGCACKDDKVRTHDHRCVRKSECADYTTEKPKVRKVSL